MKTRTFVRLTFLSSLAWLGCASRDATPSQPSAPASQTEITRAVTDSASVPKGLEAARIRDRVQGEKQEIIERCGGIEREIRRYETTLHLEVGASGRTEIADARGNHPLMDACVADVARGWTFPPSDGRTVAEVPLTITRP